MKADNLRKKLRLYNEAIKKAKERQKKGFFEGTALSYLEAAKSLPEDKYPEQVAGCLYNTGFAYSEAEKYLKAELYLQQALTLREKVLGQEHPDTVDTLSSLGSVYRNKGEFDKSEQYHLKALYNKLKSPEKNRIDIVKLLNNLGSLYADRKEFDKANRYFNLAKNAVENSPLEVDNFITETISSNYLGLQQEIARLELENREQQAALYQSKKLEYLGQMATMMAHNINQPIGVLRMAASGALSDVNENLFNPDTELKPLLEKIISQTERLSLIMSNFRNFARGDRKILVAVNLNSVIESIYQLLFVAQYQLEKIELTKELHESPIAHANEFSLQEMLISLLSNAREAVKEKAIKKVHIKTWRLNEEVGFCIEDSGDGINDENKEKLFTPFLSSKNEGMGLGLYFCREIAKDLGGAIEYYPSPLGGAGFKITLPKQQDNENGTAI